MALQPKQRLGPYEILAAVGAGGMGEVYRAHDGRLNRDVALKVLPEAFAADPDRMARFEREARVLGALNHPNIAAIYGVEEFGASRALVMELVEGPTLADRIAKGPIPLDEALPIAKQIAEALEYAHDRGVIHRDLKPANIKVTSDGTVKVLDFGLARALMDEPVAADPRDSPTLSMAPTLTGVILGTAAYMSPEQAKGKPVDRRADIWAFGVVLFEMLTGKPLYSGETAAEILAAVLTKEPDWKALPKNTPAAIRKLLRRCLEKNSRQRLQHIGEARIVIEAVLSGTGEVAEPLILPRNSLLRDFRFAWAVSFVILGTALALGTFTYFKRERQRTVRFSVPPPPAWTFAETPSEGISPAPLAISPNGQQLVFAAVNAEGKSVLWIRPLDALTAQMLPGTEGASQPFWSPDSRFVAFFAGGKLKKTDVSGGPPITLCNAPLGMSGGWSRNGVIIFALNQAGVPIEKVSASGGAPTAAVTLARGETGESRPVFLPDGQHFLYRGTIGTEGVPIYLASLDSPERKLLFNADAAPVLYSDGHVLFLRERTLMAQPFDLRKLEFTGDAFPIAEQIQTSGTNVPNAFFSASENGVLAYRTGADAAGTRLVWFDRMGKQIETLGEAALYGDVELSPDGKQLGVGIQQGGKRDIWFYDVERKIRTRFTFGPSTTTTPLWSPDGSHVVFNSRAKGHLDLYQKTSSGAGSEEVLYEDDLDKFPDSWSSDGKFIMYTALTSTHALADGAFLGLDRITAMGGPIVSPALQLSRDLFVLPLTGNRKPFPFLNTQFSKFVGQFSPDGRWVAYSSNESGRNEVYVAPFPGPGGKKQISTAGGDWPRWRHDGSEIFYLAPDNKLMTASVNGKGTSFEVSATKPLFESRAVSYLYSYAVSTDGQRFLINTLPAQTAAAPITVVLNWTAGLKK